MATLTCPMLAAAAGLSMLSRLVLENRVRQPSGGRLFEVVRATQHNNAGLIDPMAIVGATLLQASMTRVACVEQDSCRGRASPCVMLLGTRRTP